MIRGEDLLHVFTRHEANDLQTARSVDPFVEGLVFGMDGQLTVRV